MTGPHRSRRVFLLTIEHSLGITTLSPIVQDAVWRAYLEGWYDSEFQHMTLLKDEHSRVGDMLGKNWFLTRNME